MVFLEEQNDLFYAFSAMGSPNRFALSTICAGSLTKRKDFRRCIAKQYFQKKERVREKRKMRETCPRVRACAFAASVSLASLPASLFGFVLSNTDAASFLIPKRSALCLFFSSDIVDLA